MRSPDVVVDSTNGNVVQVVYLDHATAICLHMIGKFPIITRVDIKL